MKKHRAFKSEGQHQGRTARRLAREVSREDLATVGGGQTKQMANLLGGWLPDYPLPEN